MSREETLSQFTAWVRQNITGDEKGQAQIFLDRLFQAFGQPGVLDVGGQTEFRLRKAAEDGGGTAFADLVWKPVVLVEMKRRGTDLQKHFRQAFDYWVRITGGRPRYVVLCNFDEFWVYDFDSDLDAPKDKLALTDLPQRWGPLAFLAPGSPGPKFSYDREAVTRKWADAVVCHQGLGVWKRGGDAGRGYGLGVFEALGDGQIQFEKLGQQIFFGGETVGGEDGSVQGGVGVFQRVRAGQLESAVEGAQAALHPP